VVHQFASTSVFYAQRSRVQRTDSHWGVGFCAAETDRYSVPDFVSPDRLECLVELFRGNHHHRRLALQLGDARSRLDDPIGTVGAAVRRVCALRHRDHVQLDDLFKCDQRLAWPQSDALQLLVLHHQFQSLSDGNLQHRLGPPVVWILYVHHSGPGRGERARPSAGQADLAANGPGINDHGLGCGGDDLERRDESLGLQKVASVVSQRQFLAQPFLREFVS